MPGISPYIANKPNPFVNAVMGYEVIGETGTRESRFNEMTLMSRIERLERMLGVGQEPQDDPMDSFSRMLFESV